MILLQLSAAQGPAECALAVAKALRRLLLEARALAVRVDVLEEVTGDRPGTLRSVLLALDGAGATALAQAWCGSLQWISPSPYRPGHPRKNWFFGGACYDPPPAELASEIHFETLRASGAGGQHVNTTDSAVRATHLASGIRVKVQTERSQHANRRLALALIARHLAARGEQADRRLRAERRQGHQRVARGGPVRRFEGDRFEPHA